MKLGRLEKIDLRFQWKREDTEFTPWLADEENIRYLGEVLGIELEVQSREENVGPFSADILCKDTLNDHYVLIENQLERTDHTHLGQLLTYAAGLDAVTIIWIAQRFTEEHRAALDWLNRITDETFNFFGVEIELYRINDSVPAPMFKIISKPNDWSKQVKRSAASQNYSESQLEKQEYWKNLKEFLEDNKSFLKMQSPPAQYWTNLAIGRSNFHLSALVNSRDNTINIWFNIVGEKAKENYEKLYDIAYQNSLNMISNKLIWDKLENRKMCAVTLKNKGNYRNKDDWQIQFTWFKEYLEKFTLFFKPIVSDL